MLRRFALVFPGLLVLACGDVSPASLEFLGAFPPQPRIGEITTLQFLARDSRGLPMAGAEVTFELAGDPDPAGVTLSPTTALTNRGTGIAEVQLSSVRVQSVVVVATSGDKVIQSTPISFAGGAAASGRQFTFQCGETSGAGSGGTHAIQAYDDTRHLIAGVKVNCTAHVADRNGDGVPGAVVSFLTEAGTIGASATSVTDVIGNATTLYKTSEPLPKDVAPGTFTLNPLVDSTHTGTLIAPLWMHPFDWKSNPIANFADQPNQEEPRRIDPVRRDGVQLQLNPRDNLVTMIAVTSGEEGFTDINGNGMWDEGEPFDDLTEPFVDANDNGTWDEDERWVDANGNGVWDGKNNKWDATTLIWVAERILWTGLPHERDYEDTVSPIFKQISPTPVIPFRGSAPVTVLLSDPWFNSMAQNGGQDGCRGPQDDFLETFPEVFGGAWVGVALSYPSPSELEFHFRDAREPLPGGGAPPGFNFIAELNCRYTGSTIDGFELLIPFYVTGTLL